MQEMLQPTHPREQETTVNVSLLIDLVQYADVPA